ncbi:TRAP transporter substrate-binding protein [Piscinibacter sp.]|uniref:TRAP transporter substrate-binding protein n=1 Tax=Piscinibacter sp. TaxID=1903157 RepID=UPI002C402A4B|nr:TRAP transporter substrate-binding protein [Albitalea sp.]HUG23315.1 TRAP transporter substrate-binding protein [Albitalea sp.]
MQRKTFLTAALAALLATTTAIQAQTTKLRLAHAGPDSSSQHLAALELAKLVKQNTGGRLQVQVYPASQLGNDATVIGGVRGGTIDMMMAGSVNFAGLVPRIGALDLPFLFRSPEHAYKVLDGAVGQQMMKELEAHNLKGLSWFEVGFRCITTKNRTVRTPDDVRGLKIRTTPNPSHIQAFRLLGANPVPLPLGELYQALETGAVDAQEHPISITYSAKFYEVQKHLTMSRHAYTAMPVVMNKAKFDALAPDLQKALADAAQHAANFQRALNAKDEASTIADLRAKGMQVIETYDAAPFRKLVGDETRRAFVDKNGSQLLAAIDETN